MMMTFLSSFAQSLQQAWLPQYFPLMAVSIALALALRKTTRRMLSFTMQMLLLLVLMTAGSAVSAAFGSPSVARALQGLVTIILGMLLIRQTGLVFFRLIVPRLGLNPPRILEEIIILLAYGGWILIRLSSAGLDLGSLVASTAVVTAVLAFAMQDTLGNILSGLALQLDHSVNIGDWIEIEDVRGQVVQVQWRHTAVRTLFGEMVLIPNSQLMKARVMLIGGRSVPQRLRTVFFHCSFDMRPGDVIAAVEQALSQAEYDMIATSPAPVCVAQDFSNGQVTYAVRYWLTNPALPGFADSIILQHVHAVFSRHGWKIAAPAMDISLPAQADNDRERQSEPAALAQEERLQALRQVSLFIPLTDEEIRALAERLKAAHYVAGSRLAQQGETGDCLYIIVRGQAAIWLEAHGSRHLLAELGPGEVIGEMSLMTGEPRRATIIARTGLDCYILDKDSFQTTLQHRPELAEIFAQLLSTRNKELINLRDTAPAAATSVHKAAILARIRKLFLDD